MDILPIVRDLGFPVALVIYFLWEAHRVAERIESIQQDRLDREREFADQYRQLASRVIQVVDRSNTVVSRVNEHLELDVQEEETRVIRAFEPVAALEPQSDPCVNSGDESTRSRQQKHRSPRP